MNDKVENWIKSFVKGDIWREPIVGFCSAEEVEKLRKIIPNHAIPEDLLKNAKSVISYFIPFSIEVVKSNINDLFASRLWAEAYVKTNQLIVELNSYISKKLELYGFKSYSPKPTHDFDEEKLVSSWSHKHVAYLSGLGTFGHHTMIITEKGCCGRLGSLITQAEFKYCEVIEEEFCLHKRGLDCLKCVDRCIFEALTRNGLNKKKCYEILLKNDEMLKSDVCGKCACGVPCSIEKPKLED